MVSRCRRYGVSTSKILARSELCRAANLLPAREELFGFGFRFFGALFFQLLIDAPIVAEWIEDLAITRAPEHVLHRHDYFCATCHCAFDDAVRIVGHKSNAH